MIDTFNDYRALLFGIAYRMLGRVVEAEDMVQETWLRWHRQNLPEVQSPKAWLVATITRLCIDQLRSSRHEREEYYGVWLPEPLVEPSDTPRKNAAMADSLTMGFMLMLENLSPIERAVFLLRTVFDYEYGEIAEIVGKSEANCRQIVSRAKNQLTRPATPLAEPSPRAEEVMRQFLAARSSGNLQALLAVLTDDVVLYADGGGRVKAVGRPICSADRISRFFAGIRKHITGSLEYRPALINGRSGAITFCDGRLVDAISIEIVDRRVRSIYIIRNPDKLRHLLQALTRS